MHYVYLDFETTGLSCYEDEIVQWASVDNDRKEEQAAFSMFVKPQNRKMATMASKITGIKDEHLINAEPFPLVLDKWLLWLSCSKLDNITLVTHNGINFDFPVLWSECRRHEIDLIAALNKANVTWLIDTLEILKEQTPKAAETTKKNKTPRLSLSLGSIYERCFDCPIINAHTALADVLALQSLVETNHITIPTIPPVRGIKKLSEYALLYETRHTAWTARKQKSKEGQQKKKKVELLLAEDEDKEEHQQEHKEEDEEPTTKTHYSNCVLLVPKPLKRRRKNNPQQVTDHALIPVLQDEENIAILQRACEELRNHFCYVPKEEKPRPP